MKAFFQKNWIHFAAIIGMFIIVAVYFSPQFDGYRVKQHDIQQWRGMANESHYYAEKTGEQSLWTNSMFGGMPTVQIAMEITGNFLLTGFKLYYYKLIPNPIGVVFLHMLSFYFMALMFRIRPLIGVIGAIAFSFASYEIIILQAGHLSKSTAAAYLPLLLGLFVYAYRNKNWLAVALSGLVMTFELGSNHVQVTYYMIFVLLFVGIYFLYDAIKTNQLPSFLKITAGLFLAYGVAGLINGPLVLLTNDYAKNTIRGANEITISPDGTKATNQSQGLDRDYITNWSYGIGETFTLISPNVKGGGSFAIGGSQFESILDESDIDSQSKNTIRNLGAYWGEQPFTSGPVYIGVVVVLLALLGLVFIKSGIKWALLAATVLAIMLSWGKNFMPLTDFFIDYVPGYDKFRTVTIILILVELCLPVLGIIFLDLLIKEREQIKEKKNLLLGTVVGFFIFLVLVKMIGLNDSYSSESDTSQLASIERSVRSQILSMDPNELKSAYNLDVNNPQQLSQFVGMQMETYKKGFEDVKIVREDIFNASMNRSLIFTFLAGGLIILYIFVSLPSIVLIGGMLLLVMIDLIPVANEYLGKQEVGLNYKYWEDTGVYLYPIAATDADEQILQLEIKENPKLASLIEKGGRLAREKAEKLGIEGSGRVNLINRYRFAELNLATNYRVLDLSGGMSGALNSSNPSYFHKSLGGYHGAKLRNFANLIDFQIGQGNNKVFDMMNVKYIIQAGEKGLVVQPNPNAMGNAWLVKRIETYKTANDEIRALGTEFKLKNEGAGKLLVNNKEVKQASVYGAEQIRYVIAEKEINVPLSNGMNEGMEAVFVMDKNGKTDLVMPQIFDNDTARTSFLKLVTIKANNEFKPTEEVVMLDEWAAKLSHKTFTGEGNVTMTSYKPNKIQYNAEVKGNQLMVFSEVYYPEGWKATIDGKEVPILKVNYLLRAIELPDGNHKIEMTFDIPKYHTLNKVALIGSIILIFTVIGAVYFEFRRRKKLKLNA